MYGQRLSLHDVTVTVQIAWLGYTTNINQTQTQTASAAEAEEPVVETLLAVKETRGCKYYHVCLYPHIN